MLDDYRPFLLWQWIALDVEAPFRVGFKVFRAVVFAEQVAFDEQVRLSATVWSIVDFLPRWLGSKRLVGETMSRPSYLRRLGFEGGLRRFSTVDWSCNLC